MSRGGVSELRLMYSVFGKAISGQGSRLTSKSKCVWLLGAPPTPSKPLSPIALEIYTEDRLAQLAGRPHKLT